MVSLSRIDKLEMQALASLRLALKDSQRPLVAFSGGKDSLAVAHMAKRLGVQNYVCETSFYFQSQLESIKAIASGMKLQVVYKNSLSLGWLKKHRQIVFSTDSKLRGWSFSVRQQATVKKHAKQIVADCCIFGRRTEENCVPGVCYTTKNGLQCHPLRDWRAVDVWQYLEKYKIPTPWIYKTAFGKTEGNAPFYTLNPQTANLSISECWSLVSSMDSRFSRGMLNE